jgi:hypothetical protein
MATLETNLVQPSTGTNLQLGAAGDTVDIPSGATLDVTGATVTGLTTGKVLQVVSANKTDTASSTSESFVSSGLEVSITPSSTSNKILVLAQPTIGGDAGSAALGVILQRDSTVLNQADAASNRGRYSSEYWYQYGGYDIHVMPIIYLDSPSSTSSLTYKVMYKTNSASYAVYLNRSSADTDNSSYGRGASTITVMEIAG